MLRIIAITENIEALAKFILGWWHRLSSLCKCVLKVGATLMTLSYPRCPLWKNIKMIFFKFNPL
jgi:hypothetical protein